MEEQRNLNVDALTQAVLQDVNGGQGRIHELVEVVKMLAAALDREREHKQKYKELLNELLMDVGAR